MTDGTCQYLKGEWCSMDPKYIKPDAESKEKYCNTSKYEACPVYEKFGNMSCGCCD